MNFKPINLDGQIETRLKINQYLISLQMAGMRIKTKEAAVLHAIAQAERVPELEKSKSLELNSNSTKTFLFF